MSDRRSLIYAKERNMRKIPVIFGLLCLLALGAHAQVSYVGMTYNLSFPTGDTKSFVNSNSYIGFAFEARRVIRSGISAGFSLAWNGFEHDVSVAGPDLDEKRSLTSVPPTSAASASSPLSGSEPGPSTTGPQPGRTSGTWTKHAGIWASCPKRAASSASARMPA